MDALNISLQAIEAAMHAGNTIAASIDQLADMANPMTAVENPNISCEICRCDF